MDPEEVLEWTYLGRLVQNCESISRDKDRTLPRPLLPIY